MFNVNALAMPRRSVCALTSANRSSGLVLDAGHTQIRCELVADCLALMRTTQLSEGGSGVATRIVHSALRTDCLLPTFALNCNRLPIIASTKAAGDFALGLSSDKAALIASDWIHIDSADDSKITQRDRFVLPDGVTLLVRKEQREKLGEWLFRPEFAVGSTSYVEGNSARACGPQQLVLDSIAAADLRLLPHCRELLVVGGTSMIDNFLPRLQSELDALCRSQAHAEIVKQLSACSAKSANPAGGATLSTDAKSLGDSSGSLIRVVAPKGNASSAVWRGAAAMASLSTFRDAGGCMHKRADYDEIGPTIVRRFCC